MKTKVLAVLMCLTMLLSLAGCSKTTTKENNAVKEPPKVSDLKLTLGTAPGPPTYPLAYMAEQNSNLTLKPWQTGDQLISMLSSKEVQISSCPVTNAMIAYNKGLGVQVLDVAVWGMLYVMSTESDVKSLQDLKGKEIVLAGQGGLHDLIFLHLLKMNNIDPKQDLTITYLDMQQASAMLASGKIKYAVLNEPNSSVAALNAKKNGVKLNRVLDLTDEWHKLPGQENVRLPMGTIVVVNGTNITAEQIATFEKDFIEAAEWVNSHPAEIGPIVEKYVPWMKAKAVSESIKYARLQPNHAADCQSEVEAFFKELSKDTDPKAFGGKLPDAGFYYQAK
ncbi:MAG: ABC transporter substrate-binding protein [Syntrophomonadaceae bacterium]|nr:ABC transporter substrate-binding protein [Syntrophomonadaceae bacterium]